MATSCKGCGLGGCTWERSGKKRWAFLEPNGQRHRCQRYRAEKKKAEFRKIVGPTMTGKDYRPSCADCAALPWEPCRCYPEVTATTSAAGTASPGITIPL